MDLKEIGEERVNWVYVIQSLVFMNTVIKFQGI
jgi:hypothetical protein